MLLARVVGTVVATRKDPRLEGKKLLVLRYISPEGQDQSGYVVAIDTVGAGFRERVIVVSGSSARMAAGLKECPVDTAIIGIVDDLELDKNSAAPSITGAPPKPSASHEPRASPKPSASLKPEGAG
jgi:ethanolamine utilization protein EutN